MFRAQFWDKSGISHDHVNAIEWKRAQPCQTATSHSNNRAKKKIDTAGRRWQSRRPRETTLYGRGTAGVKVI